MPSTGNILDVAPQGETGVGTESCKSSSRAVHGQLGRSTDSNGGEVDELPASPLYLLASEIVDVVTKGYEQ